MASDGRPTSSDPPYKDVFMIQSLDDNEKVQLLNAKWDSVHHYSFPSNVGGKFRKIQFRWFVDNAWLRYSTSKQGVYCAQCFLFGGKDEKSKHKSLVAVPLVDPSNIGKTVQAHTSSNLHRESCEAAHNFISVMTGDKKDIVSSISSAHEQAVEKNRKILTAIVDTLVLCGRQNIAIRGHQDDRSNFAAILQLQAKHNTVLRDHLDHCNPRTKYTSPDIQNELISICGDIISKSIVEACNAAPFFGFIADEATDAATMEQMAIVLRYYNSARSRVCEDFLGYANCPATTGEALANAFVENLEAAGVDLRKMRGQGYNGAANMAGKYRGVQARIRQIIPRAIYTHCKAHSLNLAIIHASKEPLARNMMGTVQEIAFLFDYSAKRLLHFQATLAENDQDRAEMGKRQKLQTLCETRWAARADALYNFITAYGTVVESLERLSENNDTKAGAYRAAITQFSFIITVVAVEHVLSGCVPLSKLLQSTTCDLVQAATEAEDVKTQVTAERNDPLVWDTLFEKAVSMADSVGVQPSLPRGGRQQHRPNAPAQTPAEYWQINMYLPFIDHLVSELENRLLQNNERYTIQFLLPDKVANLDPEKMADIYAAAQEDLEDDLQTFIRECGRWKTRCESTVTQNPFTLESVLQGMPRDLYPNVSRCLHLLLAMPVSTASAERSFSSMRRLKTFLRSTMTTGRLSGLGLLHIHRDKEIQTEVVVDTFARRKNRRLALLFAKVKTLYKYLECSIQ